MVSSAVLGDSGGREAPRVGVHALQWPGQAVVSAGVGSGNTVLYSAFFHSKRDAAKKFTAGLSQIEKAEFANTLSWIYHRAISVFTSDRQRR